MAGYQVVNRSCSVPSRVRVRVCRSRWAPYLGPLHLLLLGEAPADDEVDGGLGKGGRDGLAVVPTRRIVCDRIGIVLDVGDQSALRLDQPRQTRVRAGQGGDISGQRAGAAQGLTGIA